MHLKRLRAVGDMPAARLFYCYMYVWLADRCLPLTLLAASHSEKHK